MPNADDQVVDGFGEKPLTRICAILGNGESIQQFRLDLWPHPVIGTNHSWEVHSSEYHCMIDLKQILAAAENGCQFNHLYIGCGEDYEQEAKKLDAVMDVKADERRLLPGREGRHDPFFACGLDDLIWTPNVMVMALQVAWGLGFRQMHIWGLDLKGPKFWNHSWKMEQPTADLQNRQLKFCWRWLRPRGCQVWNRNPDTACGAFPIWEE